MYETVKTYSQALNKELDIKVLYALPRNFSYKIGRKPTERHKLYVIAAMLAAKQDYIRWHRAVEGLPAGKKRAEITLLYARCLHANPFVVQALKQRKTFKGIERFVKRVEAKQETPKEKLNSAIQKLREAEQHLHKKIIGQDYAIDVIVKTLYQRELGFYPHTPPAFALVGPSGVGKTSLADAVSKALYKERSPLYINCPDYYDRHEITKLIGSPPGYVDSDEPGKFRRHLNENPESVIILDEFEKAHPKMAEYLLNILDKGIGFDNRNDEIDFRKTIIFLTTNTGATSQQHIGYGKWRPEPEDYIAAFKKRFPEEFSGRVVIVPFKHLAREHACKILELEIEKAQQSYGRNPVKVIAGFTIASSLKERIVEEGFSEAYGARELRRALDRLALQPMARMLLEEHEKYRNSLIEIALIKDRPVLVKKNRL